MGRQLRDAQALAVTRAPPAARSAAFSGDPRVDTCEPLERIERSPRKDPNSPMIIRICAGSGASLGARARGTGRISHRRRKFDSGPEGNGLIHRGTPAAIWGDRRSLAGTPAIGALRRSHRSLFGVRRSRAREVRGCLLANPLAGSLVCSSGRRRGRLGHSRALSLGRRFKSNTRSSRAGMLRTSARKPGLACRGSRRGRLIRRLAA